MSANEPVYCFECRRISKVEKAATEAAAPEAAAPVSLSGEDILTVVCQLCQSSLLVNEAKVGTQITCPDCHSAILVQRTQSRPKRQTGRPRPTSVNKPKPFDPDAELSLEEPAERPKIDPLIGLDEVTEDLLSAPLPEVESSSTDSRDADQPSEPDNDSSETDQPLTRRQKYERMQQRIISEGRKKMRERGRAKRAARKGKAARGDVTENEEDSNRSEKRKRRRRRKKRNGRESDSRGWVQPAFGWLRQRSLVVGWVLSTVFLSVAYGADVNWGPVIWLDRWYVMLTQSPVVVDFRLITNSILFVTGCLYLYFVCGRAFAMNALADSETQMASGSLEKVSGASVFFTTCHFSFAWLMAGLPFLYWSILFLPIQVLIAPPLLVGSWLNQSVWKFVSARGLIAAEDPVPGRQRWHRIYVQVAVAAVIACGPVLMICNGGVLSAVGCLLLGGIMIGMAGICGWHCRELSKSLETSP